jgi:radical SAM superfamily enzyme YgiQ (UPF0313 family)
LKITKSGFDEFCFGIESGNPEVLKKLKKELTLEQIFTAIEKLKRLNLKGGASLMMGLPYDTPNELNEMMDFLDKIHSINPDFKLFVFLNNWKHLHTQDKTNYRPKIQARRTNRLRPTYRLRSFRQGSKIGHRRPKT